jgi:hypothetical protein
MKSFNLVFTMAFLLTIVPAQAKPVFLDQESFTLHDVENPESAGIALTHKILRNLKDRFSSVRKNLEAKKTSSILWNKKEKSGETLQFQLRGTLADSKGPVIVDGSLRVICEIQNKSTDNLGRPLEKNSRYTCEIARKGGQITFGKDSAGSFVSYEELSFNIRNVDSKENIVSGLLGTHHEKLYGNAPVSGSPMF